MASIPVLTFVFAGLGILAGMLINRAADNLPPPARRSVLETPRCPHCDASRSALEQFGILSFALRRDKCHRCGAPLRVRAPLVEIAAGALFAFLAIRIPLSIYLSLVCFYTAILLLIVVIDLEHKLILNVVSLPAVVIALVTSPIILGGADSTLDHLNFGTVVLALIGAAVGYGLTYGIYFLGTVFVRMANRGRRVKIDTVAFGMGDVKLAGFLGALVGFPAIFYVLIYAILLGGVGALIALAVEMVRYRRLALGMAIPYGPYLVIAGWAFLVFRFAM